MGYILLISLLYKWGNWGLETFNVDTLLLKAENRPQQNSLWNLINTVYLFLDFSIDRVEGRVRIPLG